MESKISRVVLSACLVGMCIAITGCSPDTLNAAPVRPSAESTKIYRSRVLAEEAMRAAYVLYLESLSNAFSRGGRRIESVKDLVTPAKYERDEQSARRYSDLSQQAVGEAQVTSFRLRDVDLATGNGEAYVCLDVSDVRIEDENGKDVTPPARPDLQPLVVGFKEAALIDSSESWAGSGVC